MSQSPDSLLPESTPNPLPIGELAAMIGLDWGDRKHAFALRARGSAQIEKAELESRPESFHLWLQKLKERFHGQLVGVAVEASKGAIVAALLEHSWIRIYPIHPATSRRFSKAFTPSGAKDDVPDAVVLLDLLVHHRERLRAMMPFEPETRRIGLLTEARRNLVDRRTMLGNQLTSTLKNYFPQALELIGNSVYSSMALAFLERWQNLSALQKARPQTLRDFYYGQGVRRPAAVEARIELIAKAHPLTTDAVLIEVGMLRLGALIPEIRVLNQQIAKIEEVIEEAFAAHQDANIFRSLPGAGAAMAPRLCVLFGTDRERWSHVKELQQYYGIAPVIEKSGKQRIVHWRWNAPAFARQTLVEWAGMSVKACSWAKAYYQQQKQRQKGHNAILRSLAFKWLRILSRCWRDRTPYDDALYLAQLQKKNVPFLSLIPAQ